MKNLSAYALALIALAIGFSASANSGQEQTHAEKLTQLTGIDVVAAEQAPIDGFYQLVTKDGVFYVSKDGQHIFSGALHNFENGFRNLSEERLGLIRAETIVQHADTFITYKAPNQIHEIVVFYDSSCPFCVRMHQQLDSYLDQGITVHYAAFPRNGINSPVANELTNIFCAENPQEALNASSKNQAVLPASCGSNPVASHFQLGEELGVRGTPAIFTISGRAIGGGAVPAQQLIGQLNAI